LGSSRLSFVMDLRRGQAALNSVVFALCTVAAGELAFAASHPRPPTTPLESIRAALERQYHDCIPLGWDPERVGSHVYFPTANVDVAEHDGPFQALWVGIVPPRRAPDARLARVQSVMDQLVGAGLLRRSGDPRGTRYNLTWYGQQFYDGDAGLTGNLEDWPYLCYSRLRVVRLAWEASRRDERGPGRSVLKHVRVWWTPETISGWATPSLRAHAVALQPAANPAEAIVYWYRDGEWTMRPFSSTPDRHQRS